MRRLVAGAAAGALVLTAGACELEQVTVGSGERRAVVHAVLNADALQQVVLVEELLTGRVSIDTVRSFSPGDPIATAGGIPIAGAQVVVARVGGDSVVATEDRIGSRGTGVYRLASSTQPGPFAGVLSLVPGGRYRIAVRTTDGRVVTGETVIPGRPAGLAPGAGSTAGSFPFNRTRDTVRLRWSPSAGARTYAIRLESPIGPWSFVNDSLRFDLAGDLRNVFAEGIPSAFFPGFSQRLTVAAVDTNFYDYYRSGNDPFSGTGLINRLRGGIGLFGALMPLESRVLEVRADPRVPVEPAEGTFVGTSGTVPPLSGTLRIWLEGTTGEFRRLTGNISATGISGTTQTTSPHLGVVRDGRVSLAILRSASVLDTGWVLAGTLRGDTLDATITPYRQSDTRSVPIRFRRTGPPPTWPRAGPAGAPGARVPEARSGVRGGVGDALRHAMDARRRLLQRREARASAEAPRWQSAQTP